MNNLIIVTGLSGVGKSYLLKKIQSNYICECLSVDSWKDKHYARGFNNKNEKRALEEEAYQDFKQTLELLMFDSKDIVIEYPFSVDRWEAYFKRTIKTYDYDVCVVNCYGDGDFENIWDNIVKREIPGYRHPAHNLSRYIPGEQINNQYFYLTDKEALREKYEDNTYTSLNLDCLCIQYCYGEYDKVFNILNNILCRENENFERSLRNMIPKDYLKRNRYVLVNLSSDDDIDIYKTVMERNLEAVFLDTYRIIPTRPINFFGDSTFCNLVDYVTPICFFIDRLDDIDYTKNAGWFRLRNNSNDFFIDKLGVVKKVDKLKLAK